MRYRAAWLVMAITMIAAVGQAGAQEQGASRAPDTMQARVLACAACHGQHGEGTDNDYFPRLAGKPAGYLYNQLLAFRDGRRKYPPMNYLLEFLPDAYLRQIAAFFAAERAPFAPMTATVATSPDVLALGQRLATHGDPGRHVPACVSCHGASFTGMEPAIPGLLGLHADYISAQLGGWRYGTRVASEPDCMQQIAARLSEADVTAVAAWLSSQAAPLNLSPVPRGTLTLPLACGSEPQ
jgi:cytochrome c553